MNATAIKLIINLWHDDMADDPCDYDGWKVHSFGRRHSNRVEPEDIGFEYDYDKECHVPDADLQAKLDAGLAFFLDYYEHGQCMWSLSGEGPQCRWDTARFAGIMLWSQDEGDLGPVEPSERRADAKRFIERYTDWCNGSVFGYTVEAVQKCCECGANKDADVDFDLPSCGGYYGDDIDGMVIDMKDNIGSDWRDYDVTFEDNMGGYLADEARRHWKGE